jgi:hypothetical protein
MNNITPRKWYHFGCKICEREAAPIHVHSTGAIDPTHISVHNPPWLAAHENVGIFGGVRRHGDKKESEAQDGSNVQELKPMYVISCVQAMWLYAWKSTST